MQVTSKDARRPTINICAFESRFTIPNRNYFTELITSNLRVNLCLFSSFLAHVRPTQVRDEIVAINENFVGDNESALLSSILNFPT